MYLYQLEKQLFSKTYGEFFSNYIKTIKAYQKLMKITLIKWLTLFSNSSRTLSSIRIYSSVQILRIWSFCPLYNVLSLTLKIRRIVFLVREHGHYTFTTQSSIGKFSTIAIYYYVDIYSVNRLVWFNQSFINNDSNLATNLIHTGWLRWTLVKAVTHGLR